MLSTSRRSGDGAPAAPYVLSLALTLRGAQGRSRLVHKARRGEDIHGGDAGFGGVHATLWSPRALSLAVNVTLAGQSPTATSGKVFPEPVTLFTVRAFGALNLSLAIGALIAAVRRSHSASVWLALSAGFLIVPTLIAAVANFAAFDLANRPLGAVYVGAYVVLLVLIVPFVWRHRAVLAGAASAEGGAA